MLSSKGFAAVTLLAATAALPASANVIFTTGNQQYTNVNIAADTNALSIVGAIGNTGVSMTFNTMIGPDGVTNVTMHGQHGVAFVESYADSLSSAVHTGFSSISLTPQAGYAFTAGDFALDQLNSLQNPAGFITFVGQNQFGSPETSTMSIAQNGQNPYNFYTMNGEVVTNLIITVPTTDLLQDIKQVSLSYAAIPEPSSPGLLAGAFGVLMLAACRRNARLRAM